MANAANNAALKAAMTAGGYNSVKQMVNNYVVENKKNLGARRNAMRQANSKYVGAKEDNRTLLNLNYDREIVKNLIRSGVPSARPTKKQRENAAALNKKERAAANVIKKAYIKSTKGKQIRARKVKEAATNFKERLNKENKLKEITERARARTRELASVRRETVTLGAGAVGPRGTLTAAGRAVAPSNKPKPTTTINRAQAPQPSVPQRANRGAPGAFAGALSPDALAALSSTVASQVRAPRTVDTSRSRIMKALKKR